MGPRSISTIVIVGGGIVGWSAAAALKRRIPTLDVTVIATAPSPDALADRLPCTLPSIVDFHADIGLNDVDTILNAKSGLRFGTEFRGWSVEHPNYVHAYGPYGRQLGASPFYQHWLRARELGDVELFDAFCCAAALGAEGKFSATDGQMDLAYGLTIDPPVYGQMMRAYATHLGAKELVSEIGEVRLRSEDGFIDALALSDGAEIAGDLYIDASGPDATIRGKLDRVIEEWSSYLPCDRLLISDRPAGAEASSLDQVRTFNAGWRWEASSPSRRTEGVTYSSRHLADDDANAILDDAERIEIRPGRYSEPWFRNCVAIGDAAVSIEPLEWTNLHLAHSAIDRLVAMMPDTDCSPVELWDYNRQTNAEADRVRDFVMLHYVASHRPDEAFWTDASTRPLPASLEHTLTQFRERGRLPFYEEETFARDSWAAVLIGQGVFPRRSDPLLDEMTTSESARAMQQMRDAISAVVARAPSHANYLRNLARQEPR
ncbi:tryptophan 7-halogenase [Sphingomonas daechungensis]|uniref:tryptophan halogenase family protein n=1 Tax=Sphingomonas daechungensis TaxID=1176646 RepID=UPI0031E73F71